MKEVCDRHGALIIFDEIMCGLGRSGTFHAWEQLGIVPDIQAVGKGLGAGYSTISAVLFNDKVVGGLEQGSGYFEHGQTYQCHPVACAGALEVQRIIRAENLVQNVAVLGEYFGQRLRDRFHENQHVGDVRGRGFFWCVEIVKDASSKEAFDPALQIAKRMRLKGLSRGYDICLFSAGGSVDGHRGDHFLLMPPFIIRQDEVDEIVERVGRVVDSVMMEVASGVQGQKIVGLSNSA
jgi:adenosylmethionine-8-amino-7-oxononanoate aminotransferase